MTNHYKGQKVLFVTSIAGKPYYWMKDPEGVIYLAKVGDDGLPNIS